MKKTGLCRCAALLLAALSSAGASAAGHVTVWTGGGGAFSDETKWDNGLPGAESVAVIHGVPAGAVVTNDIAGFTCSQLKCTNAVPLTIVGGKISLSGSGHPLYCTCDVSVYAPVDFTCPWDNVKPYFHSGADFYAPVETHAVKNFIIAGRDQHCAPRFHSTLSAPGQHMHTEWISMYLELHAPTTLGKLSTGHNSAGGGVKIYSSGNSWTNSLVGFYGNGIKACRENALSACSVLDFGGTIPAGDPGSDTAGSYFLQYDQTVDRISGAANLKSGQEVNVFHVNNENAAAKTVTLTLNGTADSLTYAEIGPGIRIVWNPAGDFTQTFCDREHRMNRELVVKGGTVRSAGKNAFPYVPSLRLEGGTFEIDSTGACLPALTELEISGGGRLAVTGNAGETPLPATVKAILNDGSVFDLAEGVSLSVDTLRVDGVCPAPGTYTGEGYAADGVIEADWIVGAGRVTVVNAGITSWKAAADGDWSDPANWTAGVPDGTAVAYISARGGAYAVTVGSAAELPEGVKIVVGNGQPGSPATLKFSGTVSLVNAWIEVVDHGRVEVPEGARLEYSGVNSEGTRAVAVGEGAPVRVRKNGEFAVTGGTAVFSDYSGYLQLGDENGSAGTFSVSAGSVVISPSAEGDGFNLLKGGVLAVSGGDFAFPVSVKTVDGIKQYYMPIINAGGTLEVTGGVFGPRSGCENVVMKFTGGGVRFSGTGKLRENGPNNGIVFPASASISGPTNFFEVSGSFDMLSEVRTLLAVGGNNGAAVLDWSAGGELNTVPHEEQRFGAGCRVRVGWGSYMNGVHTVNVRGGVLGAGAIGLHVGDKEYRDWGDMRDVKGVVNVFSGGSVVVEGTGAYETGYSASVPQGVIIGNGFNTAVTADRRSYIGEVNVFAGGSLTGWYGDFIVGGGHGDGTLTVDGGEVSVNRVGTEWKNCWKRVFGIGILGGVGRCRVVDGGALRSRISAYVGGVGAEKFVQPLLSSVDISLIEDGTRGELTVENGTVELAQDLVLGALGYGVLTCKGASGTFTVAGDLVCSNSVGIASSGSEINLVADAAGVTPVEVAGALVVGPASKLTVDMSAYEGDGYRMRLVGWGERRGDFPQVSLTGVKEGRWRLSWRQNALYLTKVTGLSVIVR